MSYWWVNHKQTYTSEIKGGYIWSPKENSNGSRNQTYVNLTLTKPGDIVFSYAAGTIKAIGVIESNCQEQIKPSEFGKAGDVWSDIGWGVPIDWEILSVPVTPKDHMNTIAPLLPPKHSPLQLNGNGNQRCYLASIQDELGYFLTELAQPKNLYSIITDIEEGITEAEELKIIDDINDSDIESTEKEQVTKARKGQGEFRKNVIKKENKCRLTGVIKKDLLIASHIKPWKVSSNLERLDGNNGLLLSPHVDKLFDKGWITFLDNGDLISVSKEIDEALNQWGISLPVNVGSFSLKQTTYLAYHREHVFDKVKKIPVTY